MEGRMVDVWEHNLEEQMACIRAIIDDYPYISMDTEFPGVVARPLGNFSNNHEYNFHTLRCNVDLLNIIQLGLTFANAKGELCPGVCTWQFNFRFSLRSDMYAQNSIELLSSSGVDFEQHSKHGIDLQTFGELLMVSGIVLNDDVHWVTFHSGYDFAYLLKLLTCRPLPVSEPLMIEEMNIYFPNINDVKYMVKDIDSLKGGLQKIADELQVSRAGMMHTAGSDSLLTYATFFKVRESYPLDESKYRNFIYGLTNPSSANNNNSSSAEHPALQSFLVSPAAS